MERFEAGRVGVASREGIGEVEGLLSAIEDPRERHQALQKAASHIVEARPQETMEWLMATEMEGASDVINGAVLSWAQSDFKAAANWLGEQPASPNKDHALRSFVRAIHHAEPEASLVWAAEIADPDLRSSVVDEQIRLWEERDPVAVKAWKERQVQER